MMSAELRARTSPRLAGARARRVVGTKRDGDIVAKPALSPRRFGASTAARVASMPTRAALFCALEASGAREATFDRRGRARLDAGDPGGFGIERCGTNSVGRVPAS